MNFYPFHIGDFRAGTVNLSRQARWIYRDMLDVYYDTERPLPLDLESLYDALGVETSDEKAIVKKILRLKFVEHPDGYCHEVCDKVIGDYKSKADKARNNGRLGGRPKNPDKTGSEPIRIPDANRSLTGSKANHEPRTMNQQPPLSGVEGGKPPKPAKQAFEVPDWVPQPAWDEFVAMRRAKGARVPFTLAAAKGVIAKLDSFRERGFNIRQILQDSVINGWSGVFEPKNSPPASSQDRGYI